MMLEICSRTQLSWGRGAQTCHRRVYSIKYSSNINGFLASCSERL